MQEITGIVATLQTTEKSKLCSNNQLASWRGSHNPAPSSLAEAEKRMQEGDECVDWFLCGKKLCKLFSFFAKDKLQAKNHNYLLLRVFFASRSMIKSSFAPIF
jgi:hypothetical protein